MITCFLHIGAGGGGGCLSLVGRTLVVQLVNDYVTHTFPPAHVLVCVKYHSSLVKMVSALCSNWQG